MTIDQFLANIPQYLVEGTAVAGALGVLGKALSAIPWKPLQVVGTALGTIYTDFEKIASLFAKKEVK
jgi:hypothetical protein